MTGRTLKADQLTSAELRHLRYAAQGYSVPELARERHYSKHTVKSHRDAIKRKLRARTIAQAIHIAHQKGLLE